MKFCVVCGKRFDEGAIAKELEIVGEIFYCVCGDCGENV